MYYESSDFLETADSDTLKQIARTRELTREYYFSDYGDIEKRHFYSSGAVGRNRGKQRDRGWKCSYPPYPPNCVAVGNPCRVIRYFDTGRERWQHEV